MGKSIGQIKRVPSIAKSTQKHLIYFFPTFHQRFEQIVKSQTRYHKPKVINSVRRVKRASIEMIKNPREIPKKMKVVYKPFVVLNNHINNKKRKKRIKY